MNYYAIDVMFPNMYFYSIYSDNKTVSLKSLLFHFQVSLNFQKQRKGQRDLLIIFSWEIQVKKDLLASCVPIPLMSMMKFKLIWHPIPDFTVIFVKNLLQGKKLWKPTWIATQERNHLLVIYVIWNFLIRIVVIFTVECICDDWHSHSWAPATNVNTPWLSNLIN